jgi:hypothetical protein
VALFVFLYEENQSSNSLFPIVVTKKEKKIITFLFHISIT